MARWTESMAEMQHLARMNQELWKAIEGGMIIKVRLKDDRDFEGVFCGQSVGNNVRTMSFASSYYGDLRLRTLDGSMVEIDVLDTQIIVNCTSPEKLRQYGQAGII